MKWNFNEQKKVKTIEEVPDSFRGLYKAAADGQGFELRSDDAGVASAIAAVTGLNAALVASRTEAEQAKRASTVDLSPLAEFGQDPVSIATAVKTKLTQLNEMVQQGSKVDVEGQLRKQRDEMTRAHAAEVEGHKKTETELQAQLEDTLVDSQITSAAATIGADPELLMPFVRKHVKVVVEGGRRRAVVIDNAGSTQYSMKNAGQEMGIGEFIETMRRQDKYARLFPSATPIGSGANNNHQQSNVTRPGQGQGQGQVKSSTDKIAAGLDQRRRQN